VRVAAELLAGHHLPAPQLDRPRRVRGTEDGAGAAGRPVPQDAGRVRAGDPDGWLAAHVDEQRDRNAERVADPGQGAEVRVGTALLQRHQDALAHPGARGELVQRPAAIGAQRLQGAGHSGRYVGYVSHDPFSGRHRSV
jgi:hypothetical protein